jgi:hypothetical protein
MVNWAVVDDNWQGVEARLHELGASLERGFRRVTG